ncbi:unnamed protein product [Closterium sp. Naga37s-1]|nr:unnamed protein product [Closterium sp. Naga37s-1]
MPTHASVTIRPSTTPHPISPSLRRFLEYLSPPVGLPMTIAVHDKHQCWDPSPTARLLCPRPTGYPNLKLLSVLPAMPSLATAAAAVLASCVVLESHPHPSVQVSSVPGRVSVWAGEEGSGHRVPPSEALSALPRALAASGRQLRQP